MLLRHLDTPYFYPYFMTYFKGNLYPVFTGDFLRLFLYNILDF
nr:MAG TPA: hypothetical protein [Caudoviricetes sp.]